MGGTIEENSFAILRALADREADSHGRAYIDGAELAALTGLEPAEINNAVEILVESDLANWHRDMLTAPYSFRRVTITPRGRYELEQAAKDAAHATMEPEALRRPTPVGSPYGFSDEDWEFVMAERSHPSQLRVVLGHQFESDHYDTDKLQENVRASFQNAVDKLSADRSGERIELVFKPLAAGYGEHLFNEIARDIIAADIAVFETSDLNPNVILELGVALTWGVRVLPIKKEGQPRPPSDISGQTWADYRDSASEFVDAKHDEKLYVMVQRALRKKPG